MKGVKNILPMAIAAVIALGVTVAARWLVPGGGGNAGEKKAKTKVPMPDIPLMVKETKKVEEVNVLVADRLIKRGTKIVADGLAWKKWPRDAMQSNFIARDTKGIPLNNGGDYKLALTMWAGSDIIEGIPVLISMLLSYDPIKKEKEERAKREAEKKKKEEEAARKKKLEEEKGAIKEGMRAITFPVEQRSAAGITMLAPGDVVDVLISEQRNGKVRMHKYKKMKILAIDGITVRKTDGSKEKGDSILSRTLANVTAPTPKNVTLEVEESLVETMLKQVGAGGLILSLRNQKDKDESTKEKAENSQQDPAKVNIDAILNRMSSANREDSAKALLESQGRKNEQQKVIERFISNVNMTAAGKVIEPEIVKSSSEKKSESNYEIVSGRIVKTDKKVKDESVKEVEKKTEEMVVIHRQLASSNVKLDENGKKKIDSSSEREKGK